MSIDEIRARVHDREQRAARDGAPPVHRMVVPAEMRADPSPDGGADLPIVFTGHAAVFDRLSHDLGGFRERVKRGAFRKVLDASADVVALVNHDPSMVLARTRPGTLQLREDPRGLHAYIDSADTTYARDLRELVRRGDVDSMSFGFTVQADEWAQKDGEVIRTITEIGDLLDVSVVTFPAYPQTDVQARSADDAADGVPGEELAMVGPADEGHTTPTLDAVVDAGEAARGLGVARCRRRLRILEHTGR